MLHAGHELGDEEVDVRVALAVCVGRHVHRRPCDGHGEVAVIEVESAKEAIGFALSAVLRDDHAGHRFEHFTLSHEWPHFELPCRDRTLAGRRGDADEILRRFSTSARFVNVRLPTTTTSHSARGASHRAMRSSFRP